MTPIDFTPSAVISKYSAAAIALSTRLNFAANLKHTHKTWETSGKDITGVLENRLERPQKLIESVWLMFLSWWRMEAHRESAAESDTLSRKCPGLSSLSYYWTVRLQIVVYFSAARETGCFFLFPNESWSRAIALIAHRRFVRASLIHISRGSALTVRDAFD